MANQPALEPSSAPRDAAGYANVPPFQIRLLVTKLGGFSSPDKTAAWHLLNGDKPKQVDHVLALLKEWDSKNSNGAPVNGATHVAPVSPAAVAAVSPQATAIAAAAAAPSIKRTPKVTEQGPAVAAMPPGAPSNTDLGAAVLQELGSIKASVGGLTAAVADLHKLLASAKNQESLQTQALTQLQEMQRLQSWTLTALLTIAENQMGAAPLDMLRSAIGDAEALGQLVTQVREELGK